MGGSSDIFALQGERALPLSYPFDMLVNMAPIIRNHNPILNTDYYYVPNDLKMRATAQANVFGEGLLNSGNWKNLLPTGITDWKKEGAYVVEDSFPVVMKKAIENVLTDFPGILSNYSNAFRSIILGLENEVYGTKQGVDFNRLDVQAVASSVPNVYSQMVQALPIASNVSNFNSVYNSVSNTAYSSFTNAGNTVKGNNIPGIGFSANYIVLNNQPIQYSYPLSAYDAASVSSVNAAFSSTKTVFDSILTPSVNTALSNPTRTVEATHDYAMSAINNVKGALGSLAYGVRAVFSNRLEYAISKAATDTVAALSEVVADTYQKADYLDHQYEVTRWQLEQERKSRIADFSSKNVQIALSNTQLVEDSKSKWNQFVAQIANVYSSSVVTLITAIANSIDQSLSNYIRTFTTIDSSIIQTITSAYLDYDFRMKALAVEYRRHQDNINLNAYPSRAAALQDRLNIDWAFYMTGINAYREAITAYAAAPTPPVFTKDTAFGSIMKGFSTLAGVGAQIAQIAAIL